MLTYGHTTGIMTEEVFMWVELIRHKMVLVKQEGAYCEKSLNLIGNSVVRTFHASDWETTRYNDEYTVTRIEPRGDTIWCLMGGRLGSYDKSGETINWVDDAGWPEVGVTDFDIGLDGVFWLTTVNGISSFDGTEWQHYRDPEVIGDGTFTMVHTQFG